MGRLQLLRIGMERQRKLRGSEVARRRRTKRARAGRRRNGVAATGAPKTTAAGMNLLPRRRKSQSRRKTEATRNGLKNLMLPRMMAKGEAAVGGRKVRLR